jgi:sulfatase modifying factor 1
MTSNPQISKKPSFHPGKPPHQDMVWIPERTFEMGADNSKYPEEAPAHTVTVSGFWMDKYLVTNKQFQKFVKETGDFNGNKSSRLSVSDFLSSTPTNQRPSGDGLP